MTMVDSRGAKRALWTEALADRALAEGLDALSLRPAAASLGTSDRMLLYYFGTKAELTRAVLDRIAERFAAYLAASTYGKRIPQHHMVGHISSLMALPEGRPFAQLWLEIAAQAARGDALCGAVAGRIADQWTGWIERSVHFPAGTASRGAAAMMLAIVNGIGLLDCTAPAVGAAARTRVQAAA